MLSPSEIERYQRQIVLPDFGIEKQEKLKQAKILVVGVGGLGSVVSLYLTAAGVGQIGIVEQDSVSLTNLQRQILYREEEIGQQKLYLAQKTLQKLNSNVKIIPYNCYLDASNAEEIIKNYDIVMDCTDNYAARYVINDACVALDKPFIHGTIGNTVGQLAVLNLGKPSSDYRVLYPDEKAMITQKNSSKGVIGVLPCVIASLQTNEAIKILTNSGVILKDTLLIIDLLTLETRKFKLPTRK